MKRTIEMVGLMIALVYSGIAIGLTLGYGLWHNAKPAAPLAPVLRTPVTAHNRTGCTLMLIVSGAASPCH